MSFELFNATDGFLEYYKNWTNDLNRIFRMVDGTKADEVKILGNFLEELSDDLAFKENFLEKLQKRVQMKNFTETDIPSYDIY